MDTREELERRRSRLSPEKQALLHQQLQQALTAQTAGQQIQPRERGAEIPLSFAQERLWVLQQVMEQSSVYHRPTHLRLLGPLDHFALVKSLNEVVRRHESLRTSFPSSASGPRQQIIAEQTLDLPCEDLAHLPHEARMREAQQLALAEAGHPFHLEKGPLVRARLLRLSEQEHVLLLLIHHIVFDGWSAGILRRELAILYQTFLTGQPSPLPEPPIQYADFAIWQRNWLHGEVLEQQLAYWRRQLDGAPPLLELPADRPRPAVQSNRGARQRFLLAPELLAGLQDLSRREGVTLFMTLLAAMKVLLSRWSGQEDIVVGAPIAGRTHAELEGVIGFFVNTLVLRTNLSGDPQFRELLQRVKEMTLAAYAHQDLPFARLVAELQPQRTLGHNPLFQVLFQVRNLPKEEITQTELVIKLFNADSQHAPFDLDFDFSETSAGLSCRATWNTDLFDRARIVELVEQYRLLLQQIVDTPDERIGSYRLVTAGARSTLPDPEQPLPAAWCPPVQARFAAHAQRAPHRLAIVCQEGTWNYGELAAQSNRLANHLHAQGVKLGDVVAIHAARGAGLVWAMLGVLEAGGGFALLNPIHPPAWKQERLRVTQPSGWIRLLAEREQPDLATPASCRAKVEIPARLVAPGGTLFAGLPAARLPPVGPSDLASVAFTSGTTGRAKAVASPHRPLSHFLDWHARTFALTPDDRFAMLAGLGHDILLRDLFTPLWLGAVLCIPPVEPGTAPDVLAHWLREQRISVLHLTPGLARLLCQASDTTWPDLRAVFFAGEPLRYGDVATMRRRAPGCQFINYYGTTETPQAMGHYLLPDDLPEERQDSSLLVPIGRGIDGVQLLVLMEAQQLAGVGESGEIHVRTPYLARGYLNDAALTRERFIVNPFTQDKNDRLYRTGDLGRYLPDGNVEYLGRSDQQLKIHGFRIEPEAIEAVLCQQRGVRDACVVAREDLGESRLVGYVVLREGRPPTLHDLRQHLAQNLPDYMVPSAFVVLDRLPLTANSKVDRQALPAPEFARPLPQEDRVLPRTPLEATLAGIWATALGISQVGVRDDFFALGGHSLIATQIVFRIRREIKVEIGVRDIFTNPTIERLVLHLLEQQLKATAAADVEVLLAEVESSPGRTDLQSVPPPGATTDFHCPTVKSPWFGKRECNLVIISIDQAELASFERVAAYVNEFDPSIKTTVLRDVPRTELSLPKWPTLILSPGMIRHQLPIPGRIYCGCPLLKSEEYAALEKAGIAVPRWVLLQEGEEPDLSAFSEYVVRKPNQGARGEMVQLVRKHRVRWKPITTVIAGTSLSSIIQEFIYTGPRAINYRVNTLFGRVLYSARYEVNPGRPELPHPSQLPQLVGQPGFSIMASATNSLGGYNTDREIIQLGETAHSAFPDIPLLGFDIVREVPSGKLYVLEANAIGYVWNFHASQAAEYGFSFEKQFDGVRKAAYILAENTAGSQLSEAAWTMLAT